MRQPGRRRLPLAAPALRRHLQELPGAGDGLSLTQRLILRILADGPSTIGRLFAPLQRLDPLPFLGDLGFLHIVEQMAPTGVLSIGAGEKPFPRMASITDIGRDVLAGRTDFLSLHPAERWVGGVRIEASRPAWRIGSTFDPGGDLPLTLARWFRADDPQRPKPANTIVRTPARMLMSAHARNITGTIRRLVRRPGLDPAAAPDGHAGRRPRRRKRPADRAHRRRQDARRLPAQPGRSRRQPPPRPAHPLRQPAEGAGHRHRPQPDPPGRRTCACPSPSRPAPATPPPTAAPASAPRRRTSCSPRRKASPSCSPCPTRPRLLRDPGTAS